MNSAAHAVLVAAGIFLSRIAGLVRQRVFAHYFGQSDAAEAFVLMSGVAGLLAGAFSMASGEWISVRSQRELFEQLRTAMLTLAHHGWSHGDLSPYNVLLHEERLVIIDWPQIVDVIGNPQGFDFLERDATTMATWFVRKGLAVDSGELVGDLVAEATSRF